MSVSYVPSIKQFVRANKIRVVFPLWNEHVERIANKLNHKLTPKTLNPNGEVSPLAVYAEARKLMFVVYSLRKYCKKNKLNNPDIPEAWDDIIKPEDLGFSESLKF